MWIQKQLRAVIKLYARSCFCIHTNCSLPVIESLHTCRWLGNPTDALQEQSVLCWNTSSIFVVITDNCPCIQTNVTTGEVNGVNPPCCGDIYHM